MQFLRLRLAGFKSFVEPVEFRIEPGLTGVVGPNGCGKSNLLEALRWVMGANSARAMRAEGMDDVIFGGASGRAARSHAEVSLLIDNADRRAPARFNDEAMLEVARRITRGAGSLYRVNGVETRARDVQLLFADASTGANSPALIRQGQISELIAAKPANRRRILEEAAGVSGLHARRHEAHLRLNAAEANLARLDDVSRELELAVNRLKREARQAERYKRLSGEIRVLQGAALHVRWAEARDALMAAEAELNAADAAVETGAREAARASTAALAAVEALRPLREEALVAAAVVQRLSIARDRLEREAEQAEAELARLAGEMTRNAGDLAREAQMAADAGASLDRITRDLAEVEAAIAAAPDRLPALDAALAVAGEARAAADASLERLAGEAAADTARRQAAEARLQQARDSARLAGRRQTEAHARRERIAAALGAARAERAALPAADPAAERAAGELDAAVAALQAARTAMAAAEQDQAEAGRAEAAARDLARRLDDQLRRLCSEAEGLKQLSQAPAAHAYAPALDQVTPEPGYEAAVAAAFGDDLDAALEAGAPMFWSASTGGDGEALRPRWPHDATPLAAFVTAPAALSARLALTALVDRAEGPRLQRTLPVGARLVSREGDLWRWDGFTVRAGAPRPAARRLAQRARLAEIEAEVARLSPQAAEADQAHEATVERARLAGEALRTARKAPEAVERTVTAARAAFERIAREAARAEARGQALDETLARLAAEQAEADAALAAALSEAATADAALAVAQTETPAGDRPSVADALAAARRAMAAAREGEARAQAALDAERRARDGRLRRRETLAGDQGDWTRRARAADERRAGLEGERTRLDAALAEARAKPAEAAERLVRFLDEAGAAETRQRCAAEALAAAEAAGEAADRAGRAADQAAARARESRAAAAARLDAARERLAAAAAHLREATGLEPEVLAARIASEATAIPPDPAGLEAHLHALERERDAMGPVNLRAEEDLEAQAGRARTLQAERADLSQAIAKLREGVETLNAEGRERLLAAFGAINENFKALFQALFDGGEAELRLVEADDPLEAGLEIYACPPGKRLAAMSLMSGGEQALTATALIFAVFLSSPAPVCVLDEVDAPLDDANVDRFCRLLDEMRRRTDTRFIAITHNPVTMSRMDRLFGVTMREPGVSQLVSVDLHQAEALAAQ